MSGLNARSVAIAWILPDIGHYHHARLEALAAIPGMEVVAFETREDADYAEFRRGKEQSLAAHYRVVTVYGDSSLLEQVRWARDAARGDGRALVLMVPGWGGSLAVQSLLVAIELNLPTVILSETNAHDHKRHWWVEYLKARVLRLADSAVVGGTLARRYLEQLSFPSHRIFDGYDVVDNSHFAMTGQLTLDCESYLREQMGLPEMYFFASARFVPKKNLLRLIDAFSRYCQENPDGWHLVLLGDGELRKVIEEKCQACGIAAHVLLPGFKKYDELPAYYKLAGAFVLASTTEQWGLVVNEAMAAGVPVLVSERCGCVPDLVQNGVNGFTFDPYDADSLALLMERVAGMSGSERRAMGDAGCEIIARWGPERFGAGVRSAATLALTEPRRRADVLDRVLLWAMSRR